ncbi:zinc finger X-chromosomal protein-like [Hyalella azteca]|uniref:Zinc finger X-chromosomal protein-like n=1 Tax=Hyalella azteca TaxID=294128 RepID=A0A979FS45_HYAAZ|nr:zinc finger X-chromosomal protein-like [Hyalella azteca]
MDILMHDMKKCRVVMHKLPDDAVKRGWWSGLNLPQVPVAVCQVESNATNASGSSMLPDMVAANIKLEPVDEDVKDEPVKIDENQQTPSPSSCVPCKEEAQVEAWDAHQRSSQDVTAMPGEQMASSTKECRDMLHQLSAGAVCSGRRPEPSLSQASPVAVCSDRCPEPSLILASPGAGKVKSEALEMIDPSPVIKVSAISIKKELDDETEAISIKEEPFLYGYEACPTEQLSHAPASSSCLPCKTEVQVEDHGNHTSSSQNISALLVNQCKAGGSASASGDAADDAGVSGASNSREGMSLSCSQRGLVPASAGQQQLHIHQEHLASGPHRCSDCDNTSSSGSGLQQKINAIHSIKDSLQCQDCGYKCTSKKLMQKHIACKHLCKSQHQCHFCLNLCDTKAELKQHILLRHPQGNSQKFSNGKYADGCKKILHNHCISKQSTMKKMGYSEGDFACTTKGSLKRHFLYKHSTEKHIQCSEYCVRAPGHADRARPRNDGPESSGSSHSLTTVVKRQIRAFIESDHLVAPEERVRRESGNGNQELGRRVASRLADGDIRGAVRMLASSDDIAPRDDRTREELRQKHPPAPEDLSLPEPAGEDYPPPSIVGEGDVRKAIAFFKPGSAGGSDGLRPGHLVALISRKAGEAYRVRQPGDWRAGS